MGRIGKVSVVVAAVIAFIFIAICTGGNYWMKYSDSGVTGNQGLWRDCKKFCLLSFCHEECSSFDADKMFASFKATRALTVFGNLSIIVSIVLAMVLNCTEKVNPIFISIFAFVASGFMLVGLLIYAAELDENVKLAGLEYGWSFAIGWVGVVVGIITSVLGLLTEIL